MSDTQNPVYVDKAALSGDGTIAHPLSLVGSLASAIRHLRVPFTPSQTDLTNVTFDVAVTFAPAFPDTLYTIVTSFEVDTAAMATWQPLNAYNVGDIIFDPVTKTMQIVSTAGNSLAAAPAFNPQVGGTRAEGGGSTLVWTNEEGQLFAFCIKSRLPGSASVSIFISPFSIGASTIFPCILNVLAIHD